MSIIRLFVGLTLMIVAGAASPGRAQTPDFQGRAPLALADAIPALKDALPDARAYAAESLAQLGPMAWESIPALLDVLKHDTVAEVRATAAFALGRVGTSSKAVLPALRAAMQDRDAVVRISAAGALALLSRPDEVAAVAFLLHCLAEHKPGSDEKAVRLVFETLRQLGPRSKGNAVQLMPWLADHRLSIRVAVLAALEEMDDDPHVVVPGLIAVLVDEQRTASLGIVGATGRALLTPLVSGRFGNEGVALQDSLDELARVSRGTREARRLAIAMLARYGPKAADAVPHLLQCADDQRLRKDVVRALERIQGRSSR